MSYKTDSVSGAVPASENFPELSGGQSESTLEVTEVSGKDPQQELVSLNDCLKSAGTVVDRICDGVTAWKEIDKEMLKMDLHFKAFAKELDTNLDKYKSRIPIIEKQLDAVNASLSKFLDYVIAMDAKTEAEMNMKMKMMERIDLFLNTISTTMMNLL